MDLLNQLYALVDQAVSHGRSAPHMLGYFLLCVGVDFLLGTLGAWRQGTGNSSTGKQGTIAKTAIIVLAFFLVLMEPFFIATIGMPVASGVILALMVAELQSIAENVQRCGIDLPDVFANALEKVRDARVTWDQRRAEAPSQAPSEDEIRATLALLKQKRPDIVAELVSEAKGQEDQAA